jgi:hypothetical protein
LAEAGGAAEVGRDGGFELVDNAEFARPNPSRELIVAQDYAGIPGPLNKGGGIAHGSCQSSQLFKPNAYDHVAYHAIEPDAFEGANHLQSCSDGSTNAVTVDTLNIGDPLSVI